DFEMCGPFRREGVSAQQRRERALRWQPDGTVHPRHEFFGARRDFAPRHAGTEAEMSDRLERENGPRTEEVSIVEVIVVRVPRAVRERERRRDRKGVGAENLAGVAAAVGHAAKRREIAAVVPLRAVRESEIV